MGILETLMKTFFGKQMEQTTQGYAKNLTIEQIEEYEKQGLDMSEYRKILEENESSKRKLTEDSLNAVDINMLEKYKTIPRDPDSDFVKDVLALAGKKAKHADKVASSTLIYGAIVQAHSDLWEPKTSDDFKGIVFLFAMCDKYKYNTEWLLETAGKISELKNSADIPEDNKKFIRTLRDDQSGFCFKLGESLSGDADAWCATFTLEKQDAETLPLSYLPHSHIMPLLITEPPVVNQFACFELIPAKYYVKQ